MRTRHLALSGRRVLVVDADADRAGAVAGLLERIGAAVETASALHEALDVLEAAEAAFDAAVLADRIADAAGAVLARAIRTSPLLFDLRLVILAEGRPPEGVDIACPWPAGPEALAAAIVGPAMVVPPEAADDAVLDLAELESIAGGMTGELNAMLRRFAGQARTLAADAEAAARAADARTAKDRAHALKGAAFSAGAMRLGRAAQAFEAAAKAADWTAATGIDLVAEAEALAAAVEALPGPADPP